MIAEFEANLNHLRTREDMAIVKRNGKLRSVGYLNRAPKSVRASAAKTNTKQQCGVIGLTSTLWYGMRPPHQGRCDQAR